MHTDRLLERYSPPFRECSAVLAEVNMPHSCSTMEEIFCMSEARTSLQFGRQLLSYGEGDVADFSSSTAAALRRSYLGYHQLLRLHCWIREAHSLSLRPIAADIRVSIS